MGWISTRNTIIAINVISALFLFGFGVSSGMGLSDKLPGLGIPLAYIVAVGQLWILFAFWQKYI